jgi:hypothetical protein
MTKYEFQKKLSDFTLRNELCVEDLFLIRKTHRHFKTSKYFDVYKRYPKKN